MVLKNDQVWDADEALNNIFAKQFKNWMQAVYNGAYIGFNAKINWNYTTGTGGIPNFINLKYNCFLTDTETESDLVHDGTNLLYYAPDLSAIGTEYIIIEASSGPTNSLTGMGNNCYALKISSTKWLIYCSTGTDAVKRAQMIKTLYYGSNGTDATLTNSFTSVTAIKTSHANDVGKIAYLFYENAPGGVGEKTYNDTLTGTFANTTTNANCSLWSFMASGESGTASVNTVTFNVQLPSATIQNSCDWSNYSHSSDEMGIDTSADEKTNPATIVSRIAGSWNSNSSASAYLYGVVLCVGTISFSLNKAGATTDGSYTSIAYSTALTAAGTLSAEGVYISTLISASTSSSATITDCIATWNSNVDASSSAKMYVSADGGTHYEEVTESTIHRFTNTGTSLIVKWVDTRTDLSKTDSISEYAIMYNIGAGSA